MLCLYNYNASTTINNDGALMITLYIVIALVHLPSPTHRGVKYSTWNVCVFVCLVVSLSVCSHISKTRRPNFTKFSVHVTCNNQDMWSLLKSGKIWLACDRWPLCGKPANDGKCWVFIWWVTMRQRFSAVSGSKVRECGSKFRGHILDWH